MLTSFDAYLNLGGRRERPVLPGDERVESVQER